jgi:hypothetical protein
MPTSRKKILIIDEEGFCRICSALLETIGYGIETLTHTMTTGEHLSLRLSQKDIGLIITSYPYGHLLLNEIKKRKIPSFILSDTVDGKLMSVLNGLYSSYCMIKPLDYEKFRSVVKEVMSGNFSAQAGYLLV